jgi:hypothetical protein
MVPRTITCTDCGRVAIIRSYNRVEYNWLPSGRWGLALIRVLIDCPKCGVRVQSQKPSFDKIASGT